jgi:hypothetical protein
MLNITQNIPKWPGCQGNTDKNTKMLAKYGKIGYIVVSTAVEESVP